MGMVSENPFSFSSRSPTPKLCSSFTTRIFSDVAGDITIVVDGESFLLHKFPLVSRSGKIRKMVADAKDSTAKLELLNIPGGPLAFELAMKFCYGINFEITTANVAHLRCAAEYLEMTEDYRDENLIARTETYLDEVVVQSLEKSVEVLSTCETLPSIAEEVGIPSRCVEAIAMNACKEQLVSGFSMLNCDGESTELKSGCLEWWVEDLSLLRIDYYQRVICAMTRLGVRKNSKSHRVHTLSTAQRLQKCARNTLAERQGPLDLLSKAAPTSTDLSTSCQNLTARRISGNQILISLAVRHGSIQNTETSNRTYTPTRNHQYSTSCRTHSRQSSAHTMKMTSKPSSKFTSACDQDTPHSRQN